MIQFLFHQQIYFFRIFPRSHKENYSFVPTAFQHTTKNACSNTHDSYIRTAISLKAVPVLLDFSLFFYKWNTSQLNSFPPHTDSAKSPDRFFLLRVNSTVEFTLRIYFLFQTEFLVAFLFRLLYNLFVNSCVCAYFYFTPTVGFFIVRLLFFAYFFGPPLFLLRQPRTSFPSG